MAGVLRGSGTVGICRRGGGGWGKDALSRRGRHLGRMNKDVNGIIHTDLQSLCT